MKKVIYIVYMPLTEKFVKDFYFTELEKNNIIVEYWDVSALFFKKIVLPDLSITSNSLEILTYSKLKKLLKQQNKKTTVFIPQVTYEWRVIRLFFLLTRNHCKLAFFSRSALPSPNSTLLSSKKNANIITIWNRCVIKTKYLITYYLKKSGIIKICDYLFVAGELGYTTIGVGSNLDKSLSKIFTINSVDYDSYLDSSKINNCLFDFKYGVFLDEYLPYHQDFKMLNMHTISPNEYFNSLNNFFISLEQKFNLKIIIAAHPKSNYLNNPFNSRHIIKHKTCELVKYSDVVIAHMSTSISYAILNYKPLLFLVTDDYIKLNNATQYNYTIQFAKSTGSLEINADNFSLKKIELNSVDTNKYNKYKYNYLTSKTNENKLSSEIFIEAIKNM